jgi:hypothetical protein
MYALVYAAARTEAGRTTNRLIHLTLQKLGGKNIPPHHPKLDCYDMTYRLRALQTLVKLRHGVLF